ncbi:hypothetical protein [Streptomyces sp. NPDC093261]|uniref:hypothetical protein n=1 Tax=Streptomyces sp. NPDC093261 TaxID=3366037 RepID=UPI0038234115
MSDDDTASDTRSRIYRLRFDAWERLCAEMGWRSPGAASRAIGVERSTLHRILDGSFLPGSSFMAHLMYAVRETGWRHEDLFEIVVRRSAV